jgi:hypothetical protein
MASEDHPKAKDRLRLIISCMGSLETNRELDGEEKTRTGAAGGGGATALCYRPNTSKQWPLSPPKQAWG